ncbi:hypothetical protein [Tolypothrix sp. VBCCA 56010]
MLQVGTAQRTASPMPIDGRCFKSAPPNALPPQCPLPNAHCPNL